MTEHEIKEEGKRIIEVEKTSLERCVARLDDSFVKAVQAIFKARFVYVMGIGKSGVICKKIAATLTSVGTPAHYIHPVEALHGDLAVLHHDDIVLFVSKSGSTTELITLMPYLRKKGVTIIGILGNTHTELSGSLDIVIDASVDEEACPYDLAPSSSTTVALAIGDALALTVMKLKNFTPDNFVESHPLGQLGRNLTLRIRDVMQSGSRIPMIDKDKTFYESLIVMTEKQLGCVCVVDDHQFLTGIITDGDVRRILQNNGEVSKMLVGDIMTKEPIVISSSVLVGTALEIMENRERQINVLPVIEDTSKKLVGVVRIHDLLKS